MQMFEWVIVIVPKRFALFRSKRSTWKVVLCSGNFFQVSKHPSASHNILEYFLLLLEDYVLFRFVFFAPRRCCPRRSPR